MCVPSQVAKCAQYHNISIHPTKSTQRKGVDQVYIKTDFLLELGCPILNIIDIKILWNSLIDFQECPLSIVILTEVCLKLGSQIVVFINLKWQIHEQELDRLSKVWTIVLAVLGRRIICNLKTFNLYVNKLLQSNPQLKMFDQKLFSLICWTIKSVSRTLGMSCS